jgi:hypothetical protein
MSEVSYLGLLKLAAPEIIQRFLEVGDRDGELLIAGLLLLERFVEFIDTLQAQIDRAE